MMASPDLDTDELLDRVGMGDQTAMQQLLARHRERLRKMVAVRIDPRLASRVDPSDVVQETLMDVHQKLPDYLRRRPLPFYLWLRQLACERIIDLQRRHIHAERRTVHREGAWQMFLSDDSVMHLANRLMSSGTSPSGNLIRKELQERVRAALAQLAPRDREVLVLRYLEQLSTAETGTALGLTEDGVKSRQRRALERFGNLLNENLAGDQP